MRLDFFGKWGPSELNKQNKQKERGGVECGGGVGEAAVAVAVGVGFD